jgi:hypothetical protein
VQFFLGVWGSGARPYDFACTHCTANSPNCNTKNINLVLTQKHQCGQFACTIFCGFGINKCSQSVTSFGMEK